MIGRRVLVLAPHPDDEVVGAAAAIGRAVAAGSAVSVLPLTTGIPRRDDVRRITRRRREAVAAAEALGIAIAGWSDRSSRSLKDDLAEARAETLAAIRRVGADRLWVPAYEGGHQDHDTANALAWTLRDAVEVWEFAEYGFCGCRVRANAFPRPRGDETVLALDEAERARKRDLLRLYRSERGNLGYVGVERECFRRLEGYDYGRPPHDGKLFYQRFQWVPFRHPRIDFTDPLSVCDKLAAFQADYKGAPPP